MNEQKIKIIIVDDHKMLRETWKLLLQQDKRMDVISECANGEEAISAAQALHPDVMLMDINMAPINGFEATRKITKLVPSTKIIGVSVNNQPTYARNMMQSGAKGFVTKNSTREEMVAAILEVHSGGNFICAEIKGKMLPM